MDQMPVMVKGKGKGPVKYIDTNVCGITKIVPIDSHAPDYACCILGLSQVGAPHSVRRKLVRCGALVLRRVVCSGKLGPFIRIAADFEFFIASRSMGIL